MASISKLQQEKNQLQKEKDELLAKLLATKGRCLYICIELCDFSIFARVVNYRHWIFFGMRLFHSPSFAWSLCFCASSAPEVIKPTTKAAPAPIVCPADWNLFNNSCYFISRTTRSWPESQSYCQSQGGHLAIIHTAEEQVRPAAWSADCVSSWVYFEWVSCWESVLSGRAASFIFSKTVQKHVSACQRLQNSFFYATVSGKVTSISGRITEVVDTVWTKV